VLFYLKTYPTLQVLGLQFGVSDTCAQANLAYFMPFLKASLKAKNTLVARIFESQESFEKTFEGVEDIFIDGTEIAIERADNQEVQQAAYSGKKNFIQ
jgi:Helix-turn-helix of DDE superfamily endonuclease